MRKSSTIQELLCSDLMHDRALMRRYYKASSLQIGERHKNRPQLCQFRRDRIMRRLSRIQMNYALRKLQEQRGNNE